MGQTLTNGISALTREWRPKVAFSSIQSAMRRDQSLNQDVDLHQELNHDCSGTSDFQLSELRETNVIYATGHVILF